MLRHVLRQASRTAVKDNQGRREHALSRRHGHDRTTSWSDSPRGSLTAPLAAPGARLIWALHVSHFARSRCQFACSSSTAPHSSCTATYNRLGTVPRRPQTMHAARFARNLLRNIPIHCTAIFGGQARAIVSTFSYGGLFKHDGYGDGSDFPQMWGLYSPHRFSRALSSLFKIEFGHKHVR